MGPVYFVSLKKVQLFGFRDDGKQQQLNFLIDEGETVGEDGKLAHGSNAVLSMVDWALNNRSVGTDSCSIHADNCPGQNKNQYVLGYFLWRTMTRRHECIEYQIQIPGHARCLVDSGFGAIKRLYRRPDCETMDHMVHVVNNSLSTNIAVRYPSWEWRDLKSFLTRFFKPFPGIRKFQYFRMCSDDHGVVVARESSASNDNEMRFNLLRNPGFLFDDVNPPEVVIAPGLVRPGSATYSRLLDRLGALPIRTLHAQILTYIHESRTPLLTVYYILKLFPHNFVVFDSVFIHSCIFFGIKSDLIIEK